MTLAQVHKKQTIIPVRKLRPASPDAPAATAPKGDKPVANPVASQAADSAQLRLKSHLPMKIFFLLVALGLFTSTLTGIYMAYKFKRSKLVVTGLLLAGVVVPLLLLPL
jgi:hypothetical protein